jgi:hypothetical protein
MPAKAGIQYSGKQRLNAVAAAYWIIRFREGFAKV